MVKFPRNIYQVWYQGENEIKDKRFIENIKNVKLLNPNWNYYCISDKEMRDVCYKYSLECGKLYDSFDIMHLKIDLSRYVIIYMYGGIYLDMDMYILRSLDYSDYIRDCIESYEKKDRHFIVTSRLNLLTFEKYIQGELNNAMMMCSPKNPIMKQFIDYVLKLCKDNKNYFNDTLSVNYKTGPFAFNSFFSKYNDFDVSQQSDIIKLPHQVFEPLDLSNTISITSDTIAIHQYELSWINKKFYSLIYIYKSIRKILIFIIIMLILLFIYIKFKN